MHMRGRRPVETPLVSLHVMIPPAVKRWLKRTATARTFPVTVGAVARTILTRAYRGKER